MGRRRPLHEMTRELAATARGDRPASLVVRDGTLVSVTSGEILPNMSVAVQGSRVAYVGRDPTHTIGPDTNVVEAGGRYIAPGLLDGHCHIESTQLTVTQFARAVLPLGVTGGFVDAHEMTNVLGLPGLRLMVEEARATPLAAYMQIASCVPSTSAKFETAGAEIGPGEVAEALSWGEDGEHPIRGRGGGGGVGGPQLHRRTQSGPPAQRYRPRPLGPGRRVRHRGGQRPGQPGPDKPRGPVAGEDHQLLIQSPHSSVGDRRRSRRGDGICRAASASQSSGRSDMTEDGRIVLVTGAGSGIGRGRREAGGGRLPRRRQRPEGRGRRRRLPQLRRRDAVRVWGSSRRR